MRTIGVVIKDARRSRNVSVADLEHATKIKQGFILAIENEDWQALPDLVVVSGFVKSIASQLGVDPGHAVALLKRDYPPKKIALNPKPDVGRELVWGPRFTFLVGVSSIVLIVLTYLAFQYWNFTRLPKLEVMAPQEDQVVEVGKIQVTGKTKKEVTIVINNQPVLVEDDGSFSAEIEVTSSTTEIVVKAKSRSGKETQLVRKIVVESKQ